MKKESPKKEAQPTDDLRVLKVATCPSLSGKSTLTYHVGCNTDNAIHFRVVANTGTGFFNKDWTPQVTLEQLMRKVPAGKHITSDTFRPVCKGKSVNTAGFLLAALQNEGLIQHAKDNPRCYQRVEPNAFATEMRALIEGDTESKEGNRPASKAPAKTPAKKAATKKTASTDVSSS